MKKTNVILIILILLVGLYTIGSTYSIIIEVTNEDGITEIVNEINVRDVFIDANGEYNQLYYDTKNELNLTDTEANILMDSESINDNFQIVLQSVANYKVNNNEDFKLSNDELYNMIVESVNNTENISEETKLYIINKAGYYKNDISDYLYSIDVTILEK